MITTESQANFKVHPLNKVNFRENAFIIVIETYCLVGKFLADRHFSHQTNKKGPLGHLETNGMTYLIGRMQVEIDDH